MWQWVELQFIAFGVRDAVAGVLADRIVEWVINPAGAY